MTATAHRPTAATFLRRAAGARHTRSHRIGGAGGLCRGCRPRCADRRHPARRVRPGFRRCLPHHPHAESLGADCLDGDRADDREGDRPLCRDRRPRRLAASSFRRRVAPWRSPSERAVAARPPGRLRRHRPERGRQRHLRFLRRGRGAALSGAPRPDRRRDHPRRDAGRAERPGAGAAGAIEGQRDAAAHAQRQFKSALCGR